MRLFLFLTFLLICIGTVNAREGKVAFDLPPPVGTRRPKDRVARNNNKGRRGRAVGRARSRRRRPRASAGRKRGANRPPPYSSYNENSVNPQPRNNNNPNPPLPLLPAGQQVPNNNLAAQAVAGAAIGAAVGQIASGISGMNHHHLPGQVTDATPNPAALPPVPAIGTTPTAPQRAEPSKSKRKLVVPPRSDEVQMVERDFKQLVKNTVAKFTMAAYRHTCRAPDVSAIRMRIRSLMDDKLQTFNEALNHANGGRGADGPFDSPGKRPSRFRFSAGETQNASPYGQPLRSGREGWPGLNNHNPHVGNHPFQEIVREAASTYTNIITDSAYKERSDLPIGDLGNHYLEFVANVVCPDMYLTTNFKCRAKTSGLGIELDYTAIPTNDDPESPVALYTFLDFAENRDRDGQTVKVGCSSISGVVSHETCSDAKSLSSIGLDNVWMVRADPAEADAWRTAAKSKWKILSNDVLQPFPVVYELQKMEYCITNPLEGQLSGHRKLLTFDGRNSGPAAGGVSPYNKQTLWLYAVAPVFIESPTVVGAKPFGSFLERCVTEAGLKSNYYAQMEEINRESGVMNGQRHRPRLPTIEEIMTIEKSGKGENLPDYIDSDVFEQFQSYYTAKRDAQPLGASAQRFSYEEILSALGGGDDPLRNDPFRGLTGAGLFNDYSSAAMLGVGNFGRERQVAEPLHDLLAQYMTPMVELLNLMIALQSQKAYHGNMLNGVMLKGPYEDGRHRDVECSDLRHVQYHTDFLLLNNQFFANSDKEWVNRVRTHAQKIIPESKVFAIFLWEFFCLPLGVRRGMDQVPVKSMQPQIFTFCHNIGNQLDEPGFSEGLNDPDPVTQGKYLAAYCDTLVRKLDNSSPCSLLARGLKGASFSSLKVGGYAEQRVG